VSGRGLVSLLAIGVLLLAGCGSNDDASLTTRGQGITRQIAGSWTARLHQKGLEPFKIAVHIAPDGDGRVAYTGIECGGDWTLETVRPTLPPTYIFKERINEGAGGKCKGTGTVTLSPIQRHAPQGPGYTRMNYSFTGGGVTSRGLLRRAHPGDVAPVFRKVGVKPR
jgi:hypothetical protein